MTVLAALTLLGSVAGTGYAASETTTRVSVDSNGGEANGPSSPGSTSSPNASVSADGRYVTFSSEASNLVSGDTNGGHDVFVHDRQTGSTERVSVDSNGNQGSGNSFDSWISSDGRYVVFSSGAFNLVSGDTNVSRDIFVHDRQNGTTELISVDSNGNQGNHQSQRPSISDDGRYVAFSSDASNLVSDDTNGWRDIFVHDRQNGATERVSVDSNENQATHGSSDVPRISSDGRYVAFASTALNLVANDMNHASDIFVRDRQNGTTERVSVDSNGNEGNNHSGIGSISADGRYVAFVTDSHSLVADDSNTRLDVFVHDRQTGATERVSVDSNGNEGNDHSFNAFLSADGRYVTYQSHATNLVGGDTNGYQDIFLYDRQSGTTELISVDSNGNQGNNESRYPSLSADGRHAIFYSHASNLVPNDTNGWRDVFVRERGSSNTTAPNETAGKHANPEAEPGLTKAAEVVNR